MSNNIATSSKRWDLSIEMLKAIAALLVLNSHMDAMYGQYSYLGTGGSIGDALFFFCSGYGIFLSKRHDNFINWYKRRIQRIFPSVLALALIVGIYSWGPAPYIMTVNFFPSWFIMCVLLYYVLIYPIKQYASNSMWYVMAGVLGIVIVWYFVWGIGSASAGNIYGGTYFKWGVYFLYMLLGAICGQKRVQTNGLPKASFWLNLLGALVSVVVYYGIYVYTQKSLEHEPWQLFTIIPLAGICWFLWRMCCSDFITRCLNTRWIGAPILFVGGLCLEIMIAQGYVFTTRLNDLFPLNIPIIMVAVVLFSYFVRCVGRLVEQTFQKEDYDWRAIIAPY